MNACQALGFYKNLIESLQRYLEKHIDSTSDPIQHEAILSSLRIYEGEIDVLRSSAPVMLSSSAEALKKTLSTMSLKLSSVLSFADRLKNDPDIILMRQALQIRSASYVKKNSSTKQRDTFRRSNQIFQDADKLFDRALEVFKALSFDELKRHFIEFFKKSIINFDNLESLLVVQSALLSANSGAKISRKRINSLVK